ncbi:hypothetical protein WMY93_021672 [Mugilogobius chulae]|uniref:Uncharacterized protein n=1 Tax=Mugilogobius chulae TaxID=88201 RepID=A0AAW0NBA7_9GOBI
MSVQVVAAKMAEVDLKDVPVGKDLTAASPVSPEGKNIPLNEPGSSTGATAAVSPTAEPSAAAAKAGEGAINPGKMPQASAMKRTDPQQNGGEAFVNRDGTVAEAPRMKKVREMCFFRQVYGPQKRQTVSDLAALETL